ncbi:cytochrome P460 family protein [Thiogranum longum]|uniref:cytochrome P460 family protein n=1 Tax=Thiogranum longum TaxID=1537524 RepID=UPI0010539950|nr:cytochrome P460 family protein [Thiogranum longum]
MAKVLKPFIGAARPHGWVLEVDSGMVEVAGHRGFVVVKKNYEGSHISVADVEKDRAKYLVSISVMFKREAGYDPEDKDWFWAQYQPDGKLVVMRKMGMKVAMAGRLMKGSTPDKNRGCIYCHSSAGGGDYIFYPDITVP